MYICGRSLSKLKLIFMVNYSMKLSKLTKVMIIFSYEQASEKIFCLKPKSAWMCNVFKKFQSLYRNKVWQWWNVYNCNLSLLVLTFRSTVVMQCFQATRNVCVPGISQRLWLSESYLPTKVFAYSVPFYHRWNSWSCGLALSLQLK